MELLARDLGVSLAQITKRGGGSWLVVEHGDPGMVGGADPVRGLGGAS
jgi:hypothetical protein